MSLRVPASASIGSCVGAPTMAAARPTGFVGKSEGSRQGGLSSHVRWEAVLLMRSYRMVTGQLVRLCVCIVVVGFGAAVLGVAEIAAAGKSPASHGFQHVYVSWDLPAGFAFMLIGGFLLRFRVVVSKDRLTTYNVPRVRRATREEIVAIELRTKPWGILTGPAPVRVPYVRLKDDSGFWLYPLAGNGTTLAPRPRQLASECDHLNWPRSGLLSS